MDRAGRGIVPFDGLVAQVMAQAPYRSADRVFWIVDNGSSHRGVAAAERLATRWPNLILVHLPVHASWLNQIEIAFSILQRKVLRPNAFASLFELEDSILAFQERYQRTATPFPWKYTRQDLARLMARLISDSTQLQQSA
ncbi:MAG: transposase [Gemmatimonadaceae bacterium]|nr:transposase [Gemmatimonadaceae bacterium]